MELLHVENLTKQYPTFKLDSVSLSLEEGFIMGFIGRNGAGKTTTLKSMLHFCHPDSGKIFINGYDIDKDELKVKCSIGYIAGADCFYSLKKLKSITNVTKRFFVNWNEDLYKSLIKKFDLDENKKVKELSAGMKSKYQIAIALSHDAKLLILDEPTSGLDPVSRDELIMLFQDYISDGKHSIIFSTHVTSDLEKCADYITYIKKGKIIESTDKDTFEDKYLIVSGTKEQLTDDLKSHIIGLHCHKLGFEGMIIKDEKSLFNGMEFSKPTLEEIMIHIERKSSEENE